MLMNGDLGESLYKTWNNKQRRDEIAKLVDGFRAGLPIGILCKMAEAIAGSRKQARKHLHRLLTAGTPNHGRFILAVLHTLSRVTVVAPTGSQKNLALRPSRDAHRRLRVLKRF